MSASLQCPKGSYWWQKLLSALFALVVLLVVLEGWSALAYRWIQRGHLHQHLIPESFAIAVVFWGVLAIQQFNLRAFCLAGTVVISLYVINDLHYLAFGEFLRLGDWTLLTTLADILPPLVVLCGVLALVGSVLLFVRNRARSYALPRIMGLGFYILLPVVSLSVPSSVIKACESLGLMISSSSSLEMVHQQGRLTTMYIEQLRKVSISKSARLAVNSQVVNDLWQKNVAAIKQHLVPRNVHLVILESFVDPTLFTKVIFNRSPEHEQFTTLIGNSKNFSKSPVFGGGTGQAEFEILCGVPAFEEYDRVEFNAFTGSAANCLPRLLGEIGYRTVASNAYKPTYFNAKRAYRAMNFGSTHFPTEYVPAEPSYLSNPQAATAERYLFDGELFSQNLQFIRRPSAGEEGKPLFNHLLAVYGHWPHWLDSQVRPEKIVVTSRFWDPYARRVANQYYYRTEAIVQFVARLLEQEREGLIVLISDHLPPLLRGSQSYGGLGYLPDEPDSLYYNRLLVIEDGTPVRVPVLHHYDIPTIVLNYLTQGWYCQEHPCAVLGAQIPRESYRETYRQIIAQAGE